MPGALISDSLTIASDSIKHAGNSDSGWILHHIMDERVLNFEFFQIHMPQFPIIFGIDLTPTKHTFFMLLSALLVVLTFVYVARSYKKSLVPKGLANLFEILVVFVRDEIARPTIGSAYNTFLPFLLTIFFFILFGNFLGLLPFSATFTSNIAVTASLAMMSFVMIQFGGMKHNGVLGYWKGLIPHGMPVALLPLMVVVEFIGLLTKPFALAIRLFANMVAGHTVILALLGLIFFMNTYFVAPVAVAFALFIYLLEILVALIQAYIFTMLSSLFIGMAVHQEH